MGLLLGHCLDHSVEWFLGSNTNPEHGLCGLVAHEIGKEANVELPLANGGQ
jgi:hypothetical protein